MGISVFLPTLDRGKGVFSPCKLPRIFQPTQASPHNSRTHRNSEPAPKTSLEPSKLSGVAPGVSGNRHDGEMLAHGCAITLGKGKQIVFRCTSKNSRQLPMARYASVYGETGRERSVQLRGPRPQGRPYNYRLFCVRALILFFGQMAQRYAHLRKVGKKRKNQAPVLLVFLFQKPK